MHACTHVIPSITGAFGRVYKGTMTSTEGETVEVAIKTLKGTRIAYSAISIMYMYIGTNAYRPGYTLSC